MSNRQKMSNFVAEIVSVANETEINDLRKVIHNVSEKVNSFKKSFKKQLDDYYLRLLPIVIANEELLSEAKDLDQDIRELQLRLDTETKRDVDNFSDELKNFKESLIEATTIVEVVNKLSKIGVDLNFLCNNCDYYEAAQHISSASKYLSEECKDLDFLDIYLDLTERVAMYHVMYCKNALSDWKQSLEWKYSDSIPLQEGKIESKMKNEKVFTTLCVSGDKILLEKILRTMELFDISYSEIESFSQNFLKSFLIPTIRTDSSINIKSLKSGTTEIVLSSSPHHKKPSYDQVLSNLTITFNILQSVLGISTSNYGFINLLGDYIADDFLNIFIDECLTDTIPLKKEQLKKYTHVMESLEVFKKQLTSIGFLSPSNKLLEDYFGNVETLFLNKKIENYLENARNIMMKDLHEMIEVGVLALDSTEATTIKDEYISSRISKTVTFENFTFSVNNLNPNYFQIPRCSVSKSVEDLINLVITILREGSESDRKTCTKLFLLARDIVEHYHEFVPMYHAKLLADIPQYSALLHNNLLYLSHRILILGHENNQPTTDTHLMPSCLADLFIPLRQKAMNVFSEQISRQQKILQGMVKEAGLVALSEYEDLPENTERSIKGCTLQLSLLKTVWQKVLPTNIYDQIMGDLCNGVINDITNLIVETRDIRANIATALVKVLSIIENEAPLMFTEPNEIYHEVKSWSRFRELIRLLGASLAEVGERWADGKGPLAADFTSNQVRQMVKALFQLSDRRAAVLYRIK